MPRQHMSSRYLVFGPSWVGDMVLAQSLFKTLKQQAPDCTIDVAAPSWTLPLLERMPEVNAAIALPFKHGELALNARYAAGKTLRDKGYTQSIILTNSFKSAITGWAANIPTRTGYWGEARVGLLNDGRKLDKQALPKTVDRFVALAVPKGHALPPLLNPQLLVNPANIPPILQKLAITTPSAPVLALCPGAEYGEAKRWPIEHFAEIANRATAKGWQVWLFGSEKDRPATAAINRLTQSKCNDLAGKTSLGEAIDLMSLAHSVVSNDSGLMHVAAALGKPLVALYGSSDPHHTPPIDAHAEVLYLGLPCSPCFKRECPLGHLNCLKQITPEMVVQKIPSLIR